MFIPTTHIDQIRDIVDAHEGFLLYEKDGYVVANYTSIITKFPNLDEGDHAVRLRDCRGMLFDAESGNLIRLMFAKFFNYGEREEYQPHVVAQKKIVGVYDKLDGSMIGPFMHKGELRWGTKAGLTHMTPDVEAFVNQNPAYADLAAYCIEFNITPIFEYMAPKHRIVVDYGKEQMVLLAARSMTTAQYIPYDNLVNLGKFFGVPVVNRWDNPDDPELIAKIREMRGIEGVVVEYDDGTRLKIKTMDYMDLHKNREAIAKEKYVVGLILNDRVDDALGLVPEHIRPRLVKYTEDFMAAYNRKLQEIMQELIQVINVCGTKKDFALHPGVDPTARWIGFKIFDNKNFTNTVVEDLFKQVVLKHTTKSDIDFERDCRQAIFNNQLPLWTVWEGETVELDN